MDIQIWHMRGDDDVVAICDWCINAYKPKGILWQLGYIQRDDEV